MVNQFPVAEVPVNSEPAINTLETKPQEFALYLDESGSPKPSPDDSSPFFAMGGVLIERSNEDMISGIDSKTKNNLVMQLTDLCLYPVARSQDQPDNRAFLSLREKKLLVDCDLEPSQIDQLGIKYYCFDRP